MRDMGDPLHEGNAAMMARGTETMAKMHKAEDLPDRGGWLMAMAASCRPRPQLGSGIPLARASYPLRGHYGIGKDAISPAKTTHVGRSTASLKGRPNIRTYQDTPTSPDPGCVARCCSATTGMRPSPPTQSLD
jgi:hypothetical protein